MFGHRWTFTKAFPYDQSEDMQRDVFGNIMLYYVYISATFPRDFLTQNPASQLLFVYRNHLFQILPSLLRCCLAACLGPRKPLNFEFIAIPALGDAKADGDFPSHQLETPQHPAIQLPKRWYFPMFSRYIRII